MKNTTPDILPSSCVVVGHLEKDRQAVESLAHSMGCGLRWADTQSPLTALLPELFFQGKPLIAWVNLAVVCRILGRWLSDKTVEPPVVLVQAQDRVVLPMLGLHHGAVPLATVTASRLNEQNNSAGVSGAESAPWRALGAENHCADEWLSKPPPGWSLVTSNRTALLARRAHSTRERAAAVLSPKGRWTPVLRQHLKSWPGQPLSTLDSVDADNMEKVPAMMVHVGIDDAVRLAPDSVHPYSARSQGQDPVAGLVPKVVAIGLGMIRNADPDHVLTTVRALLESHGISSLAVAGFSSWVGKADEPAVVRLRNGFPSIPWRFFDSQALQASIDRHSIVGSEVVCRAVGVSSVAQASALALTNDDKASLLFPVHRTDQLTVAVAISGSLLSRNQHQLHASDTGNVGQRLGTLAVVGIGPGDAEYRTMAAVRALCEADVVIGYEVYTQLVGDLTHHAQVLSFSIGQERERVEVALQKATQGYNVVLLGSGDPGIYGLAGLVEEVRHTAHTGACSSQTPQELEQRRWMHAVPVRVIPGITAAQMVSARVGAMLGHDFAVISLSNLLTSDQLILQRVQAAIDSGLVQAWYNPRSKSRHQLLDQCLARCWAVLPGRCPVVVARDLGRAEESLWVGTLDTVNPEKVDMRSIVMVGGRGSTMISSVDGFRVVTPRGYHHRDAAVFVPRLDDASS